jgi:hypothetical protein
VHRQPIEDRSNLLEIEAISPGGVPIAERARKVALVRETEPQREAANDDVYRHEALYTLDLDGWSEEDEATEARYASAR